MYPRVPMEESMQLVAGYVLALDMTARDFQNEAKAKGHPWAMAKCFDTACPVGEFIPKARLPDGDSQIFRSYVFGPSGLMDYCSATLRCKI